MLRVLSGRKFLRGLDRSQLLCVGSRDGGRFGVGSLFILEQWAMLIYEIIAAARSDVFIGS
jgi:hypothetical protein